MTAGFNRKKVDEFLFLFFWQVNQYFCRELKRVLFRWKEQQLRTGGVDGIFPALFNNMLALIYFLVLFLFKRGTESR